MEASRLLKSARGAVWPELLEGALDRSGVCDSSARER
jgi:hypothetical protein